MVTSDAAKMACRNKHPIIDGRQANVNLAYLGAKPKPAKSKSRKLLYLKLKINIFKLLYNYNGSLRRCFLAVIVFILTQLK